MNFGQAVITKFLSLQKIVSVSRLICDHFFLEIMLEQKKEEEFIKISKTEYEKLLKEQEKMKKNETTTIQIRITKEKKRDWEEFVENNPNFKNTSQLIRSSVNAYIFPDYYKGSSEKKQVPEDFDDCFRGSLSLIDSWSNYSNIRELEEIIKEYNKNTKKEQRKENVQRKLLDIQNYLLNIILEISSLIIE